MKYEIVDDFNLVKELHKKYNKAAIIWDENINPKIVEEIGSVFNDCILLSVSGKDYSKTIETYKMILSHLVSFNLDGKDLVIGIGGGATLDLAGFVASTYHRGVDLVYIPTTLLSMVDSSIGGKNGINIDGIKNMAGTFYLPSLILVNHIFLETLDDRVFKEGVAEIIKIFALFDKEYFELVTEKPIYENRKDKEYILDIIRKASEIKNKIVLEDPKDVDIRQSLNLGHTFGHAIESASSFKVSHGEAVSVGMVYESEFFKNYEVLERIKNTLKRNGLPINSLLDRKTIIKDIVYDKKRNKEYLRMPVLLDIGKFEFRDVKIKDII